MTRVYVLTLTLASIAFGIIGYVAFDAHSDAGVTIQRLTRIEQSVCTTDPGGAECAEQRRQIARQEPLRNPCISFRRIIRPRSIYRDFTRCGEVDRHRGPDQEGSDDDVPQSGAAAGGGATGGPAPDGGSGGAPGDGGDGGADDPPPAAPGPGPSDPGGGEPPPGPDPTPNPPAPPPAPPSLGDRVDDALDQVCALTGPLGVCIR